MLGKVRRALEPATTILGERGDMSMKADCTSPASSDVPVVPEEAIQKNRATANHHHRGQDQANRANNRVDAHTDVRSYQQQARHGFGLLQFDHLQVDTVLS